MFNFKGLQNDIRPIARGKFDIEAVTEAVEELNGDNKVILWYVLKF